MLFSDSTEIIFQIMWLASSEFSFQWLQQRCCECPLFWPILSPTHQLSCEKLPKACVEPFSNSQLFDRQKHQSWQESGMLSIGMCLSENHTLGCHGSLRSRMHVFQGNAGTGAWWCVWGWGAYDPLSDGGCASWLYWMSIEQSMTSERTAASLPAPYWCLSDALG